MFGSNKVLAAFYFIACVICLLTFIGGHKWGYLIASVVWLMMGIYCLISKDDEL